MRANINGTTHRIVFQHDMQFKMLPALPTPANKPPRGERKVPIPFTLKLAEPDGKVRHISRCRAVTTCRVLTGAKPDVKLVAQGVPAVCSWKDPFDKEFARQLALARVLETLPREVGGPLLGAYMESGPRTLCNLANASHKKYDSLPEALPK